MLRHVEIASFDVDMSCRRVDWCCYSGPPYNQVMPTAPDCVAWDRLAIILVLFRVIKDNNYSTTNSIFVGDECTMYSTKLSFHQYST
jgi:hypothetical protein